MLVVLKGKLALSTNDREETLSEGDVAYIPGGEPHVVKNPQDEVSIGVDVFGPGRSFDFWLKRIRT